MPSSMVVAYDAPVSRRPRTPKAKTKEFLTSFSVHVLRTRQCRYTHTHTHIRVLHTWSRERERGRLHIRVTTISRTYRRQTFGKETDGENESSSRGWMGNADAAPSKEARTSALWIHTHTCTQWGSDSQPPFEISSSRILYILYTSSCHFPTHFSSPLEIRRNGWIQPGVVNFFLLLFLPSQPLEWIDRLFFSIRVCTSCVEECDLQKRNERESKVTQFGWPSSEQQVDSVCNVCGYGRKYLLE